MENEDIAELVRQNAVVAIYFDSDGYEIAREPLEPREMLATRQFSSNMCSLPHPAPCHSGEVPRRLPNGQIWCYAR